MGAEKAGEGGRRGRGRQLDTEAFWWPFMSVGGRWGRALHPHLGGELGPGRGAGLLSAARPLTPSPYSGLSPSPFPSAPPFSEPPPDSVLAEWGAWQRPALSLPSSRGI